MKKSRFTDSHIVAILKQADRSAPHNSDRYDSFT